MVKRQKEKQYLSATEQKAYGRSRSNIASSSDNNSTGAVQKALPFKCCALTLTSFENPVCTIVETGQHQQEGGNKGNKDNCRYGIVFDNAALMEFVLKNKKNPVTGDKLTLTSNPGIITLHMDKDSDTGDWQCPVMTKSFSSSSSSGNNNNNNTTKIVAILTPSKKEAYVYSYEAYFELNVKPKNYIDLTTGHKFSPKTDVLILNDPQNDNFQRVVRDVSTFWHIKNARSKNNNNKIGGSGSGSSGNVRKSVTATRVMEQLCRDRKQREEKERIKAKEEAAKKKKDDADNDKNNNDNNYTFDTPGENLSFKIPAEDVTGVKYTTGSGGFTSTAADDNSSTNPAVTGIRSSDGGRQLLREATKEEILQSQLKIMKSKSMKGRKGYVRLFVEIRNNNNDDHHRDHHYDNNKKKKATTKGEGKAVIVPLLLELHCDIVPKTCANFLGLCRRKRYDGTIFHRLIPDFMIQGGGEKMKQQQNSLSSTTTTQNNNHNDNGNGNGNINNSNNNPDASLWGPPFEDEFDQRLKHDGEGVLCMANAGPNTNKQQFYITLSNNKSQHLDRKHSVFGKIVEDGMKEFTNALHNVKTDSKDRPIIKTFDTNTGEKTKTNIVVVIVATEVLDDPAMAAQEKVEQRLTKLHEVREAKTKKNKEQRKRKLVESSTTGTTTIAIVAATATGVGKYLSKNAFQNNNNISMDEEEVDNIATSGSISTETAIATRTASLPSFGLPTIGPTIGPTVGPTVGNKIGRIDSATKAKAKFGDFSSW